jgi:hypothetical protein
VEALMTLKIPNNLQNGIPRISIFANHFTDNTKIYLHFYNPIGAGDWYVIEGNKKGRDFEFIGIVFFTKPRLTRFTLKELRKKKLPFGEKIRLNERFEAKTWSEIMSSKIS